VEKQAEDVKAEEENMGIKESHYFSDRDVFASDVVYAGKEGKEERSGEEIAVVCHDEGMEK